jgi:hypothetical protein
MTVRNGTATLPWPATAAGRAQQPPDDGLRHAFFTDDPTRTLCGRPRNAADSGEPYDGRTLGPDHCRVCIELAEAYIVGGCPQ